MITFFQTLVSGDGSADFTITPYQIGTTSYLAVGSTGQKNVNDVSCLSSIKQRMMFMLLHRPFRKSLPSAM